MPYEQQKKDYIIYKIICNDESQCSEIYVGSTADFTTRKSLHKSNCNNQNQKSFNYKIYQTIRDNGGWKNWTMIPIEELKQNTKREAEIKEEQYRKELKASLNMVKAYQSEEELKQYRQKYDKQYYDENKKQKKEYDKQYYDENKKQKKEYNKKYREQNREYYNEYQKQHYNQNKEQKRQYQKQYYNQNKYKINEKIVCDCGVTVRKDNLKKHKETKKHLKLMLQKETK